MKTSLHILLSILSPIYSISQILYPESEQLDYHRVIEIKNSSIENRLNIFPSIMSSYQMDSIDWDIWNIQSQKTSNSKINILPVRWSNHFNNKYARGYNDGAVWKGRGLTSSLQGGVQGKFKMIDLTLAPIFFYSQNSNFSLAPLTGSNNIYNYQFRDNQIDYVQRYGDDSFTKFNLGQSEIRLVYQSITLGVSTQNIIWGPGQQNSLIMSNNASGIPHLDFGTYKPIETKIGIFEGKIYYGVFKSSIYFSENDSQKDRFWTGMSIGYSPIFLPELTLGFNRSLYKNGSEFELKDLLAHIGKFDDTDGNPSINDEFDQIGSITMRWLFRDVGFEMYAEYGKNDYGGKFWGTAPEHARGYVLGFNKYLDIHENSILKLTYEHTSLDKPKNSIYRRYNSWYSHGIVHAGYTIDGQIIGGGIGTGSVSDLFEAHYFIPKGRWLLRAQRIRFDDDYFFAVVKDELNHDHEWTFESKYSQFIGSYLIGIDVGIAFRKNQYFIIQNDKSNLFFGLNFTKRFNN